MELAKLPGKIASVVIARSFCYLPNALVSLLQKHSRLSHAPFNNPLLDAAPRFRLH
jgi:hypothetical protein